MMHMWKIKIDLDDEVPIIMLPQGVPCYFNLWPVWIIKGL